MSGWDKRNTLKLVLIIEVMVLLGVAAAISRNYQDSWILEGLEIPYAVFMITYATYVFVENKISWVILFSIICRSVIVAIPNVKYDWFQGVAPDQHRHYRLAQDILSKGYIPSAWLYSETPNMHLSFSIYSLLTNISLLHSFKYFPILSWIVYPLVIYIITNKVTSDSCYYEEKSEFIKYVLFISSIPVKPTVGSYLVIGTSFGGLFSFLFLWQIIKVLRKRARANDRRDWIIAIIYVLALVSTHTNSSIIVLMALLSIYSIISLRPRKFLNFRKISYVTLLAITLINLVWFTNKATNILKMAIKTVIPYIHRLMGFEVIVKEPIPIRFFELSFIDELKIVLAYHGGDILLMFLTLIGIVVVVKKFQTLSKSALMFLSFYLISLWMFLVMGVSIFRFGQQWYDRIIRLSLTVSPIFCGISLFHINKRRNIGLAIFIISLILLSTIQHYRYQPLVPPASSISKDLPTDEPVVYIGNVNSVYQRYMIKHAERYVPQDTFIACDRVTSDQIIGLTNHTFSLKHLSWYYPFSRLLENGVDEKQYDYFLTHLPGKSGAFFEQAEIRTEGLINYAITSSNIIYTNGESFILGNTTFF